MYISLNPKEQLQKFTKKIIMLIIMLQSMDFLPRENPLTKQHIVQTFLKSQAFTEGPS